MNLIRLSAILNHALFHDIAKNTLAEFITQMQKMPTAVPQMMCALDAFLQPRMQFVIAGDMSPSAEDTQKMLRVIHSKYIPNKTLIHVGRGDDYEGREFIVSKLPFVRDMNAVGGTATVYLCYNFTCQTPANDPEKLATAITTALSMQSKPASAPAASGSNQ
eukprot:GEZU01043728.1.p1 GENE.GEZU01043728.1~~GEZU01043728.1.p1  ORF type:complete len:177 (+),score=51.91 GEZU01043728.1:46-531(+)